jgi:hypothetical protein
MNDFSSIKFDAEIDVFKGKTDPTTDSQNSHQSKKIFLKLPTIKNAL